MVYVENLVCMFGEDSMYGTHIAYCNRHAGYSEVTEKAEYDGYSINKKLLLSERVRRSQVNRESVWRPERPLHKSVT